MALRSACIIYIIIISCVSARVLCAATVNVCLSNIKDTLKFWIFLPSHSLSDLSRMCPLLCPSNPHRRFHAHYYGAPRARFTPVELAYYNTPMYSARMMIIIHIYAHPFTLQYYIYWSVIYAYTYYMRIPLLLYASIVLIRV